jgi:NADH-quinone oxidoreductase subunit J
MELVAQNVFFFLLAIVMVVSALRVVTTRDIVHAALWLILVLAGAAGQFILLYAEFAAVVQVLVYIGAIVVLFLFGIMLTRAPLGPSLNLDRKQMALGAAVAVPLLVLLSYTLWDSWGDDQIPYGDAPAGMVAVEGSNTKTVSDVVFGQYMVAFQVIGVLLVAALIGAIVLARRD